MRVDNRGFEEIFRDGFRPKGEGLDLDYVGTPNHSGGYVSASADPDYFKNRADINYAYDIEAPGGVDINRSFGEHTMEWEREIGMPGGIRPERIRGCWEIKLDESGEPQLYNWVPNPNHVPLA